MQSSIPKAPTSLSTSLVAGCAQFLFLHRRCSVSQIPCSTEYIIKLSKSSYSALKLAKMGAMIRPEDDQRTLFVATAMSLLVLTVVAILLRFLSRWIANVGLWWDDYLILLGEVGAFIDSSAEKKELMASQLVLIAAFSANIVGRFTSLKS